METIENVVDTTQTQLGGRRKKSNGHKQCCVCPICKNMKHSKRGGSEDVEVTESEMTLNGGKKKNGHKANCGCPICINMKHAKRSRRNKQHKRRGTKKVRGGSEGDELDGTQHGMDDESELDKTQHGMNGGRRKKKRSNGHKSICKCPICKNMKGCKRGGEGDIEDQKGDIEEGFEKGVSTTVTTKADDDEYENIDEITKMEEGEAKGPYNQNAYENVGGKRRSRKNKSKRHRKRTRRHRRH